MDLSGLDPLHRALVAAETASVVVILLFCGAMGFLDAFRAKDFTSQKEQERRDQRDDKVGWPTALLLYCGIGAVIFANHALNTLSLLPAVHEGVSDPRPALALIIMTIIAGAFVCGNMAGNLARAWRDRRRHRNSTL